MKILPYIFALCCLLSCTKPAKVASLLEEVEQIVDYRPNHSLRLLESISHPEQLPDKERAVWWLLWTRANDKKRVPHTSDSLITRSIDYFRTNKDRQHLAWALYCDGRIHYELNELEHSKAAFFEAEELASQIGEFTLLGKVYECLEMISRKQGWKELVMPLQRKRFDESLMLGDSLRMKMVYQDISRMVKHWENAKAMNQLKQEHAETKFSLFAGATGIVIVLLVLALVFIEKSRRRKIELLRMANEVAAVQQKYLQMVAREESMEDLRKYCLKDSFIYSQLIPLMGKKREVKDFKMAEPQEQDWEIFFRQMDFVYTGFVTRLKEEYGLKEEFLKLACLILLDIHPCNLKNLFHVTNSAITNKRISLAEKLGIPRDELNSFLQALCKVSA